MPCVGDNAFTTLPSYSVNLVCHLPFKEVEALRVAGTSTPTVCPKPQARPSVPTKILPLRSFTWLMPCLYNPVLTRRGWRCYNKQNSKMYGKEYAMKKLDKVFLYISFGFLGMMLILLCAMGVVARQTEGVGAVNTVLQVLMYVSFGISAAFFILSFIFDIKRRRDGRK